MITWQCNIEGLKWQSFISISGGLLSSVDSLTLTIWGQYYQSEVRSMKKVHFIGQFREGSYIMIIWIWKACKNMEIGYYITSLLYADVTPLYRDGHATETADMQWCESWSICDFVAVCCHIHIFLNPAYTRIVRYWRMVSSGACFFWIQAPSLEVKRLQLQHWLLKSWAFLNAHTFSGPVNRMFQQYMEVAISIQNQGSLKCIKNQDTEIWKIIHKCPHSTVLAFVAAVRGSVGYVYSHPIKTTSV